MLNTPASLPAISLDRIAAIVGPRNVLTAAGDMAPFLVEPRELFSGAAAAVVQPGSTQEVAEILRVAAETRAPVVTQGGNTGLVGGQIPAARDGAIILTTRRLDRVREVDIATATMTLEAGVTLARAQQVAAEANRLFPLSLGSEGSCTIGGNLGTNAGGTAVIAYGNARDLCLGVEVVLADGRIHHGLSKLRKDNTGYDLTDLFIGSEGTLGIITAAVLVLKPRPQARASAFLGLATLPQALAVLERARATAGDRLTGIELMPRIGLDFVLRHLADSRDPLAAPHPWYLLVELSSPADGDLDAVLEGLLASALEAGEIEDAAVARSLKDAESFWRMRKGLSEVQKREGGSIKHDISVPVAVIPDFVAEANAAVVAAVPGARPCPFGHLGDGNLHYNISQPVGMDRAAFIARWDEVNAIVHAIVRRYEGSVAAEHGVGRLKRDLLARVKDPVALDLMRAIKAALDPQGILNPGVLL